MENSFQHMNLSKPLLRALEDLQLSAPTPIQEKAFPVIMSGRDAVGISQTGTGKTLAYLLPILRQLEYSEQRHPRVLILAPTRELVAQILDNLQKLSKYMSIRSFGVYGESNINTQKQHIHAGLDILIATPGRLIDLIISRSVLLTSIKKLVVDEVDEMFALGFRTQITQILDALPLKRQNISFSATLSEETESLIQLYFKDPVFVELVSRGSPIEKIKQAYYLAPNMNTRLNLLKYLIQHQKDFSKVLVFVKNKDLANELEEALSEFGEQVGIIHSNKSQANRFKSIELFENGTHRILIATDVVARGLDFKNLSHVVNFDFPKQAATYIHRIGRTGRADKSGNALSLLTEPELPQLKAVEKYMGVKIKKEMLPKTLEISDELRTEEMPKTRIKKIKVSKFDVPTGAFHEKKGKNKKIQLGGKRRQEKQRRALEKSRSKRKR
ncbi:MAG: DEAD/DEAH box helicase [Bacteroidia bacterium]|nr:DEAD/DEAH box helicase [Bacteroidia bacterium]